MGLRPVDQPPGRYPSLVVRFPTGVEAVTFSSSNDESGAGRTARQLARAARACRGKEVARYSAIGVATCGNADGRARGTLRQGSSYLRDPVLPTDRHVSSLSEIVAESARWQLPFAFCPIRATEPRAKTLEREHRGALRAYDTRRGEDMRLCPIALAVHCSGCPAVNACLGKRLLGDFATYLPMPLGSAADKWGFWSPVSADASPSKFWRRRATAPTRARAAATPPP